MDADSAPPPAPDEPATPPVRVQLEYGARVNFALQQNAVPMVRTLRIASLVERDLDDVTLTLMCEPRVAAPLSVRLARLPAGGVHECADVDLRLEAAVLVAQTEREAGVLRVTVAAGGVEVLRSEHPFEVLAYHEWSGDAALPEILAAFVLPNHPAVEPILATARDLLRERTGDPSLSGYQTQDPQRALAIVDAVHGAILRLGLTYVNPPASFEEAGQKIRTPDRIVSAGMGTCLDLALLYAACLEQAGLHALVLLREGHAWCGAWLVEESFPEAAVTEPLRVRKRVDLGRIVLIETTLVTSRPQGTFAMATARGREGLDDPDAFRYAVDVRAARRARIRPIALRTVAGQEFAAAPGSAPFEPTAVPAHAPADDGRAPAPDESPRTRLDRWKRRLLDLTLRNRLLNFRETKLTIPLACPEPIALEDALADGAALAVLERAGVMGGGDPRSAAVHRQRTGEDAERAFLLEELGERRLHATLGKDDLDRRLLELYRAARRSLEENGSNTLYLALGFLTWYETPASTLERRAPLLLLPLELTRTSVHAGFRIRLLDEEPRFNVTLLRKLETEFDIHVPSLDPLPEDENGLDVARVFRAVREAVLDKDRWDVAPDAAIGLFSFTKYLMWLDLEQRAHELRGNAVVDHLVARAGQAFEPDAEFPDPARLDATYAAVDTFCPLDADSSQLAAVHAAAAGRTFVLQGPPGTGKSQTITNLIAHCLALGQRVLFVAEKTAALEVVLTRLERVGLRPFSLAVHSNKARKKDVLDALAEGLAAAGADGDDDWQRRTAELDAARATLNAYCDALHRPRGALGLTAFSATARRIGLDDAPPAELDPFDAGTVTAEDRAAARRVGELIEAHARQFGGPDGLAHHPLRPVHRAEWAPDAAARAEALARALDDAVSSLRSALPPVLDAMAYAADSASGDELALIDDWRELVISTPAPPTEDIVEERDWDVAAARLAGTLDRGRERDERRAALLVAHHESLFDADLDAHVARLRRARTALPIVRWFAARPARLALGALRRDGAAPRAAAALATFEEALAVRAATRELASPTNEAARLFGASLWCEGEADWDRLARLLDWATRFRNVLARAAGGHPERSIRLRRTWLARLVETPGSLQPGGAVRACLDAFASAREAFETARGAFAEFLVLDTGRAFGAAAEPDLLERAHDVARAVQDNAVRLRAWCDYQRARAEAGSLGLTPLIERVEDGGVPGDQVRRAGERAFLDSWLAQVFAGDDLLREFSSTRHALVIERFRELDDDVTRRAARVVQARLAARLPRDVAASAASTVSEMGTLRRQLGLKSRHMPLRRLFAEIPNVLARVKPCLLMSPLSVAQYLSPEFPPFDLVVFDEASQIPVWDAIGAIARGTRLVVVGDSRQLPPTTFFEKDELESDLEDDEPEELESILDECVASGLPELPLGWHYRSRHESLIAFSNHHYYHNRLLTFPGADTEPARLGVSLRVVEDGVFDRGRSRTNRREADALVAEIVRRVLDPAEARRSIGVVTFSQTQQTLVDDLIEEERRRRPEVEAYFAAERLEPLFVKNLENVQGDERDVILFSVGYGPDAAGRVYMNFGPLNRVGGERRLNVAVTRAREQVVVFSSLRSDRIDLSRTRALGVRHLRDFLDYAERGPSALTGALSPGGGDADSPFEEDVESELIALGHNVHRQVGCSGYRIDLAVTHPDRPGRYVLGVECDGASYHSARTARDRDRLRAAVLRNLGWRLHRVWSTDWWYDRERELVRLDAAIRDAVERVDQDPPPVVREQPSPDPDSPPDDDRSGRTPQSSVAGGATTPPVAPDRAEYVAIDTSHLRGDPDALHAPRTETLVIGAIEDVAAVEAPLVLDLLERRIAELFGVARMGRKVSDRVALLLPRAAVEVERGRHEIVIWRTATEVAPFHAERIPGASRPAEHLPLAEVAAAALGVLAAHIALPLEDLCRETARVFGIERLGAKVRARMELGVRRAETAGRCAIEDGSVRLL